MASVFMLEEVKAMVSNKIDALVKKDAGGLERYREELKQKGVSLIYTLSSRSSGDSDETKAKNIENVALVGLTSLVDRSLESFNVFDTPQSLEKLFSREVLIKTSGQSQGLKLSGGRRITSLLQLGKILNVLVSLKAEEIMKDGSDSLRYRTGRLANSVSITRLNRNKDSSVSIWFDYMRKPYDTFRPDIGNHPNVSARTYRDPRWLFSRALAAALQKALSINTYKTTVFKLRFGNSIAADLTGGKLERRLF